MSSQTPSFVRENVRHMSSYAPGEQPAAGERIIKLNTNENPFPPSPKVIQAIREIEPELLRRYPQPTADAFRHAAAGVLGVEPEMILAGNGSDDILTIATRTFVPPGGRLAVCDPSYSLYPILADIEGASIDAVPWVDDWQLPTDALIATHANAVYLANPNAPSGTVVPVDQIARLAKGFGGVVLVDEAYVDFADDHALRLLSTHDNVIISRTLSKAYALAGIRFGFAVARPGVIEQMMKVKDSYNCDAVSIVAATAAVLDQEYARMTWEHVRQERERLTAELRKLGFVIPPSHANFILARTPDGDGGAMYRHLKRMGILVRYFDCPVLRESIRITVGSVQENNALLAGVHNLLVNEKAA